jgi:hypothetical protein
LVTALTGNSAPVVENDYTYTPVTPTALSAANTYWLVTSAPTTAADSAFSVNATTSLGEDAVPLSGWSIGDVRWVSGDEGIDWGDGGGGVYIPQFTVQVTAVPEPATFAAWLGLAALTCSAWRGRRKAPLRE